MPQRFLRIHSQPSITMVPTSPSRLMRAPPAWARWFRSDDLDEVREAVARLDGEHSRVAQRAGPLGFESDLIVGDICSAAWVRVALPLTIRGALPRPLLHLGPPSGTRYRMGRQEYMTDPGDAMFIASGWEITRLGRPGPMLAVAPDEDRLLEEIAARGVGRPDRLMLTTRRPAISRLMLARLAIALEDFVSAKAPDRDAYAAPRDEATLLAAVADILIEGSAVIPTRGAINARVADVESWIDANLDRPITAGQLCRVAGMSLRGLEKAFESRRGMSPMRFVAERRLAAAHRSLVRARPGDDVTTIASAAGFNHMGRFASSYRQAFGESPSQSLKRAQRARA